MLLPSYIIPLTSFAIRPILCFKYGGRLMYYDAMPYTFGYLDAIFLLSGADAESCHLCKDRRTPGQIPVSLHIITLTITGTRPKIVYRLTHTFTVLSPTTFTVLAISYNTVAILYLYLALECSSKETCRLTSILKYTATSAISPCILCVI